MTWKELNELPVRGLLLVAAQHILLVAIELFEELIWARRD